MAGMTLLAAWVGCAPLAGAQTSATERPVGVSLEDGNVGETPAFETRPATVGALAISAAAEAVATRLGQAPSGAKPEPSTYDKVWTQFTQWYKNDTNPVVQQVLFSGRYQQTDQSRGIAARSYARRR